MKKLIILSLFATPFFAKAQFTISNSSTTSLLELREGTFPLELQRVIKETDTCYELEFRDQQFTSVVNMSTLKFGNLQQLRYFMQALAVYRSIDITFLDTILPLGWIASASRAAASVTCC